MNSLQNPGFDRHRTDRRQVLASVAATAMTAPAAACAPRSVTAITTLEELELCLQGMVDMGGPPGISIAVTKGSVVRYARGFGLADSPRHQAATAETVYNGWSLTKVLAAVAVLQLAEAGRLDLDAPVADYLGFFRTTGARPGWPAVTVRHLLCHSSGLGDIGLDLLGWIHHDPAGRKDQTRLAAQQFPRRGCLCYRTGSQARYSNLGYMVLGALIEARSGRSFEDYVRTSVLGPAGMARSDFVYQPAMLTDAAAGSHPFDAMSLLAFTRINGRAAIREKVRGVYWFNPVFPDAAAPTGLMASVMDLARFLLAWQGYLPSGSPPLLSPAARAEMARPQVVVTESDAGPIPGLKMGLGWFCLTDPQGRISLTHGGNGMGFVSMMRLFPQEGLGIVVMANSTYLGPDQGLSLVDAIGRLSW